MKKGVAGSANAQVIFATDRLLVRPYSLDDRKFVLDMYSRRQVQQFLGPSPKPLVSVDGADAAIGRWRAFSDGNPLIGLWAVTLKNGEPVGTVLLKMAPLSTAKKPLPLSNDFEVGWHLHPDHWGHGYATEAAAGALRRGFDAGVGEVIALIHPENARSKHVAERLQLQHLGLTDRYYSMQAELYRITRDYWLRGSA